MSIEEQLRGLAPRVLGTLVRRYGRFDACEDAVQEALLAAARQWPRDGVPDNPYGWLFAVAARRLIDELTASGEWVGGEGLADVSQAKVVRVRDGVPAVTDGPYLEAKEHLAGYCMIDCDSLERALEVAANWPDARWMGIELRAVMSPGGEEM